MYPIRLEFEGTTCYIHYEKLVADQISQLFQKNQSEKVVEHPEKELRSTYSARVVEYQPNAA